MARSRGSRTATLDTRVVAVALVRSGVPLVEVAHGLSYRPQTVRRWVTEFTKHGMDGLRSRRPGGRRPRLGDNQLRRWLESTFLGAGSPARDSSTLRGWARRVAPEAGVEYDVDHLARRIRDILRERDRNLPARQRLKSPSVDARSMAASPSHVKERDELDAAIRSKDATKVHGLLERNPQLVESSNADGLSPLTVAVYAGAADIVSELSSRVHPTIFEASAMGNTLLLDRLLVRDPALVRSFSPDGWTPLHLAAHFGQAEAARLLISRGAFVNTIARNGVANQPLQAALAGGSVEVARILIEAHADVNHRSHGGVTAAHLAAVSGSVESMEMLRKAGADLTAKSTGGKSPLDFAREYHRADLAAWLERTVDTQ